MTSDNHVPMALPTTNRYPTAADYPWLFRLLHWLLWPSLVVLVLTGLSQHAVASPEWSLFSGVLPGFFWSGRMHLIHIWASLVFSPVVLAVAWIYWRRAGASFRTTHRVLLAGSAAMVLSGLLLATGLLGMGPGPTVVYLSARGIHALVGLGVLPIAFLWHAAQGLTRYRRGLVAVFHPWARPTASSTKPLLWFVPLVLLTTCLRLGGLPDWPSWRTLSAKRIATVDVQTGGLDALPWETAEPLRIDLAGGLGFAGGRTRVTLQALHDGRELFVRAQWCDPTEDRRNMPWVRTALGKNGWKRLVTHPDDETHYYEDKFSLIFPIEPNWQFDRFGCALQCHAGDDPSGSRRQYGYKCSSQMIDVWHWKSTRTDPCGQVDDKYWSEIDLKNKDMGRYGDPKQDSDSGYHKNVSQDNTRPKYLPRGPGGVHHGIIPADHAVQYDSDEGQRILEGIVEGAIVPGIVASAAVGDRGDVHCISHHDRGRWQLIIRRRLDTGSRFDTTFLPGQAYSFGCAAFDHASKRHAYNMAVYRLVLQP